MKLGKFEPYRIHIIILLGILLTIAGIWIFNSLTGGVIGVLATILGFGSKEEKIKEQKVKVAESDKRKEVIEKEVVEHKKKVEEHYQAAVKAGEKVHDKPKTASEKENAFKNRSSRKPGS
jgi:hypothetical protein